MSDPARIRRDELTVAEVGKEDVSEEASARDSTKSLSTGGLQRVHGVKQGSDYKTAGPDHRRRIDEETLADTANRVTNQLRRQHQKPLVYSVKDLVRSLESQISYNSHAKLGLWL
jgi:hypothetical protein